MADALIRAMTAADVGRAAEMIRRGEWGDRSVFLGWAVEFARSHLFVAEDAGRIVGTGIATANGSVGWVGTIFVAPDRRREGFGDALTRTVIDDLESRGCRTLVLTATDAGRPLYERLGSEAQMPQGFFTAAGLAPSNADDDVLPFDPSMLSDIIALDRLATGEDRSAVLERLASAESSRVLLSTDGALRGFLIRAQWGGVALIAPEADDAIRLLEWRRRQAGVGHPVYAGFPDTGDSRRARLLSEGWSLAGAGTRMIRGEPLEWRPDWIWGTFSGALG
ncbi:MAG TPA: GNAT family N-acetyltransferase [Candidatus Dormibacteraeota bacterium]|nr:GNAT family N-acetyltransferase [Candidatus Dormibacteraeota bacterium]